MKDELRAQLKKQRRSLSTLQQQEKSSQITSQVVKSLPFKNAQQIAFYYAVSNEANPQFFDLPEETRKEFYLPVLSTLKTQSLLFSPVNQESKFQLNKYAIPEPICSNNKLITGNTLDLVIVPLLGFDISGNRLGMGGGYYDRSFSFKNKSQKNKPILMGFAYAFQEVENLLTEDWDVKLDYIATENGIIKC